MEQNVVKILEVTAKNVYEMLMQVATHIRDLEAENAVLKEKLKDQQDDFK